MVTTETIEIAAKASKRTGETIPEFVERAANNQAKNDDRAYRLKTAPVKAYQAKSRIKRSSVWSPPFPGAESREGFLPGADDLIGKLDRQFLSQRASSDSSRRRPIWFLPRTQNESGNLPDGENPSRVGECSFKGEEQEEKTGKNRWNA
jgi:hypothetical protein